MLPKNTVATHCGVAISDISDHHGTLVNVSLKSAHKKKASNFSFIPAMKNFQLEKFTDDLSQNLRVFFEKKAIKLILYLTNSFLFLLQW